MGFFEGSLLADIVPGAFYDPFVFAEASFKRCVLYGFPSDEVDIYSKSSTHMREN